MQFVGLGFVVWGVAAGQLRQLGSVACVVRRQRWGLVAASVASVVR